MNKYFSSQLQQQQQQAARKTNPQKLCGRNFWPKDSHLKRLLDHLHASNLRDYFIKVRN